MQWVFVKLGRGSYVNMNVIPIPSPGLGRLRVGGLASQMLTTFHRVDGDEVVM